MKTKKTLPINFIISLCVHPFDVMVSIGQSDKQLAKSLEDTGAPLTEADYFNARYTADTCKGRAVMFSTNASLIRLRSIPKNSSEFGQMAHEVFHVTTFVINRIGMKLIVMKSDEAYAYLIEYITTQIYERINKYY